MTIKQVQLLLAYLGYDPGPVDGLDGPRTKGAAVEFQKEFLGQAAEDGAGEQTREALQKAVGSGWVRPEDTQGFWNGIRHFRREEFRCRCGRCGGFPVEPEEGLVRLAEQVRAHFDVPVTVSSGVRCRAHNREVGGVLNSRHLLGKAVDFSARGVSARELLGFVQGLEGVRYAYGIDGSYVHMDVN